ncbi:hypothetical protein ACWIGI_10570 [Nocardia sp. NPDC055321]
MVGTPSRDAILLALSDLRGAAQNWANAHNRLVNASVAIPSVRISESEMGIFNEMRNRYRDCPEFVLARVTEGQTACREIAEVLADGHDTYLREEQANLHAMKRLY